jgi:D-serine deaminase-like pyridoxal phosphate-dependent protein
MTIASMSSEAARDMFDGLGLSTPRPVVDREILDANLAGMAKAVSQRGCALRPHFKTHRSIEIARRQIAHGAKGLTCATVAEAEVLADRGFTDIFIAYPLWADDVKGERLRELQGKADLKIGVDSVESLERLAAATRGESSTEVIIEIDPGFHRSGVRSSEVLQIARAAEKYRVVVAGVFAYPGHAYDGSDAVESAAKDEQRILGEASEILSSAGISPIIASGGSTPTAYLSAEDGVVSDVRPGVYVFNDRQQVELGTCQESDVALVVFTTVVSTSVSGSFVVDAGSKALSSDRLPWMDGFGVVHGKPDWVVRSLSEHHGVVNSVDDTKRPAIGEIIAIVPNHVCNVVNLFNELLVIDRDGDVAKWPVVARGGFS